VSVRKLAFPFALGLLAIGMAVIGYGWTRDGSSPAAAAVSTPPTCPPAERASWQKLADEIDAPVYCPGWLPSPLEGRFGGRYFNGRSVDPDRSYLVSFAWFESGQGLVNEVHVNLRGYPGTVRIPACEDTLTVGKKTVRTTIPCFSDRGASKRVGGVDVDVYTANQGADTWHVLYAWRENGSLYTLSQHVAPPYTYAQVVSHLDRMMRRLVLVRPSA
jgi:hypothetical protein